MNDQTTDRRDNSAMINLITEIHKDVKSLDARLSAHMCSETSDLANEVAKLMTAAFPEGDPATHRQRHEAEIRRIEARAAFWEKMRFEITRWGLIGVIGWLVVVGWRAFLKGPL